jgi:1-acyl-sn-glycerol-3-phosphate acyltransferase
MTQQPLHVPAGHRSGEQLSGTQRFFYDLARGAIAGAARLYFRLEVVGGEHIPAEGAFILSPSHRSNLDTPLIAALTRRRLRYMGKESLWANRASGWFFTSLGGFPVQRGSADREAMRVALEVLERGEPLAMFPEGTRQRGPEMAELHDGPAYLACRAGVPIVPVGLAGTEGAMPKGARWIRPVKMVFVIGPPVAPPEPGDRGRVPRRAVRELTEQLRQGIQAAFDEARERAGHPDGY